MLPIPIIRLEVDNMRHAMSVALSEYSVQMDEMVQEALAKYCSPENLRRIIDDEANRAVDLAVRDAVKYWFLGTEEGKEVIRSAVAKKLEEEAQYYK